MKKIFISGPYRAPSIYDVKRNILAAEDMSVLLMKLGYAVFCPHKNTGLLDGAVPDKTFLDTALAFLPACDAVVVLPWHHRSEGTKAEIKAAGELGLPVLYRSNYYTAADFIRAVNGLFTDDI